MIDFQIKLTKLTEKPYEKFGKQKVKTSLLTMLVFFLALTPLFVSCKNSSSDVEIEIPNENKQKDDSAAVALVYGKTICISWKNIFNDLISSEVFVGEEKIADETRVQSSVYGNYSYAIIEDESLAQTGAKFSIVSLCNDGKQITEVTAVATGLPVVTIDTKDCADIVSKDDYIKMNIAIYDANSDCCISNTSYVDGIRRRGNSTFGYPKKPFRIKFDKKTSLFGREKAKSWALLANYLDPTLLMNDVTFKLGEALVLPFTNHGVSVDLILNGRYMGTYLLTEQVQVGKGRVDIDEDKGILAELDVYFDEEPKFKTTNYELPVMFKNPEVKEDDISLLQDEVALLNAFDAAVYNEGNKTVAENLWTEIADVSTFAKFLLINQIVKNGELGHPKSTYIYRDKGDGKKICAGPLWDFDWAFGYKGSGREYFVSGTSSGDSGRCAFFQKIWEDETFRNEAKKIWNENKNKISEIADYMQSEKNRLEKSAALNRAVWGFTENTSEQIDAMSAWWLARLDWMNSEIASW